VIGGAREARPFDDGRKGLGAQQTPTHALVYDLPTWLVKIIDDSLIYREAYRVLQHRKSAVSELKSPEPIAAYFQADQRGGDAVRAVSRRTR